jgi:hypothetical protein
MVLAAEIEVILEKLRPLANQVHDLIDSHQPTLAGFIDAETLTSIGLAIREERRGRVDTTDRPAGLQWMRGTTTDRPLGAQAAVGRGPAVSSAANTAFTLADLARRLQASIDLAGVGIRVIPPLPPDPSIGHLAVHLVTLTRHAARTLPPGLAIQKLRSIVRELQWLLDEADVVIDGTMQTPYGACPHCGRPTIVVDFRAGVIRCDADRRTGHLEECRCGDDYCHCRFHPVEFRHEWSKSKAGVKKDGWHRFAQLRNRPSKTTSNDSTTNAQEEPE